MIDELKKYGDVSPSINMEKYNTFHIGGLCKCLLEPYSISDLQQAIRYLKDNNIKYFIIGNGSNLVLSSKLNDIVFIKLTNISAIAVHKEYNIVYAEAGAMLPKLASISIENELTGLEFAMGIPGTIGGSIVGNAGAYNSCILDYVKNVTILDDNLEIKTLEHEDIKYGYRTSMFKEKKNCVILAAKFYLKNGDKENSLALVEERRIKRLETQPLEYPSAGSVFRNPKGDYAGAIIENCKLKGISIGGATVSTKHANFIINDNNATSEDVYNLINHVHKVVLEETKVDLVKEQEFVGWE
ncbi:MAG: UDP-N-acetylmuramate dehydrogenase [Bacilli bacterium]